MSLQLKGFVIISLLYVSGAALSWDFLGVRDWLQAFVWSGRIPDSQAVSHANCVVETR